MTEAKRESWSPRLRADVRLDREGARPCLVDPRFARRIPAGPLTQALAERLTGARSLDELCAELPGERADAESALRALLLLGLVEGEFAAGLEPAPATREARVLPQARFGCQASGNCCRVFRPGPLTEGDRARLAAAEPALLAAFPHLPPPETWIEEEQAGGYLRRIEGACEFLLEDHRCAIHAAVGFDQKPECCRLFPFDVVRTLRETRVHEVAQCSRYAESTATGETHAEAAPAARALAADEPSLFHPLVLLPSGAPCDYSLLAPLEARLLRLCDQAPLGERVPRLAALAWEHAGALAGCPLDPAEPSRSAAAIEQRELASPPPAPEAGELTLALHAAREGLLTTASDPAEREAPLLDPFRDALDTALTWAAQRAGLADGEPPEVVDRAAELPLDLETADRLLATSLRNRLYGAKLLVAGHLAAGVLRLALLELIALTSARLHAAEAGAERVEAEHLSAGHWVASLCLAREALARALVPLARSAQPIAHGAIGLALTPRAAPKAE